MNEQLEKDVAQLTSLILKARQTIKTAKNKEDDLVLATEIIEANLYVGKHHLLCEQQYELRKSELIANGMTAAAAESKAKTEQVYYNFKRCRQLYEMGEECIRIMKKAGDY